MLTLGAASGWLACPPASAASPEDMVTLAPISPWNVDYADNYCALQRVFGSTVDPVYLRLNKYLPGESLEVMVVGQPMKRYSTMAEATLELEGGAARAIEPLGAQSKDGIPSILFTASITPDDPKKRPDFNTDASRIDPHLATDPAFEAGLTTIAISSGKSKRVTLNTGPMAKPMAALRRCMDNLLADWGIDPKTQVGLTRLADPVSFTGMEKKIGAIYPSAMAAKGGQARVNFFALVDATGTVTRCTTAQSYNDKAFDSIACMVVKGTRFHPALDANGKPVASYFGATVVYRMH